MEEIDSGLPSAKSTPGEGPGLLSHTRLMFVVIASSFAVIQTAKLRGTGLFEDYDSLIRMVSVRGLLAGQEWYDSTLLRVLPPEGLDLHWSRLLDAVLAGLVLAMSLLFERSRAETIVMAGWPIFLLAVFALILGKAVRDRFGDKAASLTMLVAVVSQLPRDFYFQPGHVDHHNLQLVLMAAIGWAATTEGERANAGLIAGILTALSLAIGLETVGFIAFATGFLVLRFIMQGGWEADRLGAFALGLMLAAPIFFAAQTPFSDWLVMHCDVLALPVLAVTTITGLGSLLLCRLDRSRGRRARFAVAVVIAALGMASLVPVLAPCRGGPYSMVSPEVQLRVIGSVIENQPLGYFLRQHTVQGLMMLLPFAGAVLLLAPTLGSGRQRDARVFLFGVALFGLVAGLIQTRMMIWGWVILPAALGVVLADFTALQRIRPAWFVKLLLVACAIFPHVIGLMIVRPWERAGEGQAAVSREVERCATKAAFEPLDQLPPSLLFNPIETAAAALFHTRHSVTGASYHRSPRALTMGVLPFLGADETGLKDAVQATGADYVVLCRNQYYGDGNTIGTRLAAGETLNWLSEVELDGNDRLRLLKVEAAAF